MFEEDFLGDGGELVNFDDSRKGWLVFNVKSLSHIETAKKNPVWDLFTLPMFNKHILYPSGHVIPSINHSPV